MTETTKVKTTMQQATAMASDTAKRLQQAELLLSVSRRLAALDSMEEVLETLVEMISWELNAERGSLFLNDPQTAELYSIIALGNFKRKIRILNTSGIAGHVFTTGKGVIVDDVYADERFNREVDQQTGYVTKNIICVPIRTVKKDIIGVAQVLNKKDGTTFSENDFVLLEALTQQAAVALQSAMFIDKMNKSRTKELEFLDIVADVTSEIDLNILLNKVMKEATRMLMAERSTLFLNDEKTNELWSFVGEGIGATQIRFPNHMGIAGTVFTTGKTVNIPYAYADLRFNPAFDRQTGYFTRSILCVPVVNKDGKVIGVTQVLNKQGGPFSDEDESRLKAFTAQVSIALENAKLFDDIQNIKNYNESMLQSMSNGVITMDEEGNIVTCNKAGLKIFQTTADNIVGTPASDFFTNDNAWVIEKFRQVDQLQQTDLIVDAELFIQGKKISANITIQPLISAESKKLGTMIMIEDITNEKRMKSTMSRYMNPEIADQLLADGGGLLGGQEVIATVLFADIRGFTSLTEELGAQETVKFLNEYFTVMVDCIRNEEGMLDKFIGDAIMAAYGLPVAHADDEDRAVRSCIAMINALKELNKKRASNGHKPVDMGIGLSTDKVVAGNIGSPKRMDYTIIGDGVNMASRLESACKQYSARIIISDYTYKKLKGTYRIRDIDDVIVKGKTKPVRIFEVLDYHTEESFPNAMEVASYFKNARHHYRSGDWDKSINQFNQALMLNPDDQLSAIYIDRCRLLKSSPPKGEWNGVWRMSSK